MPIAVESALYRTAQEALTNVVKHALDARKIDVVLEFAHASISLTIADDGPGFAEDAKLPGNAGIGLRGMRQRIADVDGTLEIGSRSGKGTIVTTVVPLTGERQRSVP